MITTKIPQNIKKYKTKAIGPLSLRQLLIGVIIVVLDFIIYKTMINPFHMSGDTVFWIYFILDTCLISLALEPDGINMETYIKMYISNVILSPCNKSHKKTDFVPVEVVFTKKELKESKKRMKKLKKSGEIKRIKYE